MFILCVLPLVLAFVFVFDDVCVVAFLLLWTTLVRGQDDTIVVCRDDFQNVLHLFLNVGMIS